MNSEEKPNPTPRLNFSTPVSQKTEEAVEEAVEAPVEAPAQASTQLHIEQSKQAEQAPVTEDVATENEEEIDLDIETQNKMKPSTDEEVTDSEASDNPVPSLNDLEAQKRALEAKIAEQKAAEKQSVISQIKTVVNTYGITTEELIDALGGLKSKRKGTKAKPKYRNPQTGATWSGRGKAPLWIRDQDYEQFRIAPEGASA